MQLTLRGETINIELGQEWSEELANYFDDTNKAQMESLLMLLNMAYELGYKEGKSE